MRVVADTNIWVSGLLWRGAPWELLRLAEAGEVTLCMTPDALAELAEVLSYERLQPRLEELGVTLAELIGYVANLALMLEVQSAAPIVIADPDDDVFLRCADGAEAAYVVSGDRHLLDLDEYAGIPIITIKDFLAREFPNRPA